MVVVERGLGESRGVPKRHTEDAVRAFVAHQEHNEGTGNDRAREETQPVSTNFRNVDEYLKRELPVFKLLKSE